MKIFRRRINIVPIAIIFAFVLSASQSAQTNALSLSDVTNTLGNVLGLNNNNRAPEAAQQPAPAATQTQQPQVASPAPATQSTQALPVGQAGQQAAQALVQPTAATVSAPPVASVPAVTAATTDTGGIARQVAAAQTSRSINPVEYTSGRIGTEFRDELYALAAVTLVVGMSLYGMTFLGVARTVPAVSRRPLYIK
ncbi:MAG: hypothetical protein EOO17_01920 [Chloroflexi bacterium]|nr:MAG: hypothetical protein EOO17_01920 [Chloroflexota bacterium]